MEAPITDRFRTSTTRGAVPRVLGQVPLALVVVLVTALACLGTSGAALAQEPDIPPSPTRWVTDKAGLLSDAARQSLDQSLETYERSSGHQVIVYIDRTTGEMSIEELAARALSAWGVGRKGIDDGLILFIFTEDRRLRIEVGYGLEGEIPDLIASRIIREVIVPRLQAGDADAAVTAGVGAIVQALGGDPAQVGAAPDVIRDPPRQGRGARAEPTLAQKALGVLLVLGFLVLLITNPRLALWLLVSVLSSRGGGRGGGGFGGGFSGGGGRSGGGGASGSW